MLWLVVVKSSALVGFLVGAALGAVCAPFAGMAHTMRMALRAQLGSLNFVAWNYVFGYYDALAWRWTVLSAGAFGVSSLTGVAAGCVAGTMLCIWLGVVRAADVEEEMAQLRRCADKNMRRMVGAGRTDGGGGGSSSNGGGGLHALAIITGIDDEDDDEEEEETAAAAAAAAMVGDRVRAARHSRRRDVCVERAALAAANGARDEEAGCASGAAPGAMHADTDTDDDDHQQQRDDARWKRDDNISAAAAISITRGSAPSPVLLADEWPLLVASV